MSAEAAEKEKRGEEKRDSYTLCPACQHEYGYHDREGHCHKGCCGCGADHNHHHCST